jgi:arylsulfatase A-like enzyme
MLQKIQPGMSNTAWVFGTFRPHLPFIVPKEYFDLFPEEVQNPPGLGMDEFDPHNISTQRDLQQGGKLFAKRVSRTGRMLNRFGEYNAFVKSYLAAIAYADALLGKLLDRMEECGLWDDTLIVLWTDHGWQFGEKLSFRKFTLWERALHVPFIFSGGDIPTARVESPVSTVDMAPTILSLLGLPEEKEFSGQDLAPAIRGGKPPERDYAPSSWVVRGEDQEQKMGISIRSERYRYIKYWNDNRELYDHADDPWEYTNLALPKRSNEMAESVMADLGEPLDLIKSNAKAPRPTGTRGGDDDEAVDDD